MTGLVLVTALLIRTQTPAPAETLRDPFESVRDTSSTELRDPFRTPSVAPAQAPLGDLVDPFARTQTARPNPSPVAGPRRSLPSALVDPFAARPAPTLSAPTPAGLVDPFGR